MIECVKVLCWHSFPAAGSRRSERVGRIRLRHGSPVHTPHFSKWDAVTHGVRACLASGISSEIRCLGGPPMPTPQGLLARPPCTVARACNRQQVTSNCRPCLELLARLACPSTSADAMIRPHQSIRAIQAVSNPHRIRPGGLERLFGLKSPLKVDPTMVDALLRSDSWLARGYRSMPLDKERDRQLVIDCQEARLRDDRASYDASFGDLFKGHYSGVMAIARRATRKPEDAEEVCGDAFKDLDDYISRVDPDKGSFGLLRIFVFHRAAEKYSAHAKCLDKEESFDTDKHPEPVSASPTVETCLIDKTRARILLARAERLARIVFSREAGAPNERIIFLFCRALAYKPARLADARFSERKLGTDCELSGALLAAIEPELEREWTQRSELRPDRIRRMFEPLRGDMDVVLRTYPLHGRTRELYSDRHIWELPICQGRLREYFRTSPPTEDIRMWCVNVEKRVVKLAKDLK